MALLKATIKWFPALFYLTVGGLWLLIRKGDYSPVYRGFRHMFKHKSYQISYRILMNTPGFKQQLDERYNEKSYINWEQLVALPPGTLGREYVIFMNKEGVTSLDKLPEATQKINPELDYIRARARLTHDIHHVVCGFPASEMGEMAISAFYVAQINSPLNSMVLAIGLIKATMTAPERLCELMEEIVTGYQMGKRANNLFGVKWEDYWSIPVSDLRQMVGIDQSATVHELKMYTSPQENTHSYL